jgi:hypothetical protein
LEPVFYYVILRIVEPDQVFLEILVFFRQWQVQPSLKNFLMAPLEGLGGFLASEGGEQTVMLVSS